MGKGGGGEKYIKQPFLLLVIRRNIANIRREFQRNEIILKCELDDMLSSRNIQLNYEFGCNVPRRSNAAGISIALNAIDC